MNRAQAKKMAIGLVAADLSANLGANAWEEQGLLDEYDLADRDRIHEAAYDLLAELHRRCSDADGYGVDGGAR